MNPPRPDPRDTFHDEQIDGALDRILSERGTATPPPASMHRWLRSEPDEATPHRWVHRWAWAAVLLMVASGAIILRRGNPVPVAVHAPFVVASVSAKAAPPPARLATRAAMKPSAEIAPVGLNVHGVALSSPPALAASRPEWCQFPLPAPMTNEERLVLQMLRNDPRAVVAAQVPHTNDADRASGDDSRPDATKAVKIPALIFTSDTDAEMGGGSQ